MKRLILCCLVAACAHHDDKAGKPAPGPASGAPQPAAAARLVVTSPAFANGADIPAEHTCEGGDVSPPLAWSGAPAGTKAFAVIVDDPDAPDPAAPQPPAFVHWVVAKIPASATSLAAGAVPPGVALGQTDFDKAAWGGPCPPKGKHRYYFRVYALDADVGDAGISKSDLLNAMQGHILAQGELVGMYQKKPR
jgi:Raf kinase inhibitor-like YbhB/YbcL family protein